MRMFLLLALVIAVSAIADAQTTSANDSPVTVVSFKWSKVHQAAGTPADKPLQARAVNQNDKNFDRTSRINDPAGVRDPNADTLDARGQELEKNARGANNPSARGADVFTYQAKIHNHSQSPIEIVFWEYQFTDAASSGNMTRRQFLCGINLKPDKEKELLAVSSFGPTTLSAATPDTSAQEKVIINRVEFADGKAWMRKDWNAGEIKESYKRAMATPWSPNEVCRSL